MMGKDALTELALLFRERDPQRSPSITSGVVISPPPNPRIRLNEAVILERENLVFAAHMVAGYERRAQFTDAEISTTGSMQWTDTVKAGDEVILIPVEDGQLYYVIDKGVRF